MTFGPVSYTLKVGGKPCPVGELLPESSPIVEYVLFPEGKNQPQRIEDVIVNGVTFVPDPDFDYDDEECLVLDNLDRLCNNQEFDSDDDSEDSDSEWHNRTTFGINLPWRGMELKLNEVDYGDGDIVVSLYKDGQLVSSICNLGKHFQHHHTSIYQHVNQCCLAIKSEVMCEGVTSYIVICYKG